MDQFSEGYPKIDDLLSEELLSSESVDKLTVLLLIKCMFYKI